MQSSSGRVCQAEGMSGCKVPGMVLGVRQEWKASQMARMAGAGVEGADGGKENVG